MPDVIATLRVKEDQIERAKSVFKQLAADTLADETGTLAYLPLQSRDDAATFIFYEKYDSDEAFALHGKNLAAKGKLFAGLLAGPPEVVVLDEL